LVYHDHSTSHSLPLSLHDALPICLSHSPGPDLALEMKIALAESYAQAGDYADSIPLFGDAVAARPDSAELRFNLATAYAHNHDYAQAAKQYKETLRIDPHHNQAELSLAKALMNLSTVEDALRFISALAK